jgi:hypothetical protein
MTNNTVNQIASTTFSNVDNLFLKDYSTKHQQNAVFDSLKVSYKYKDGIGQTNLIEYPKLTQIYNYIDKYLVYYPNETDFWEILNKNLVIDLLTKPILRTFDFDKKLADIVDN